MGNAKSSPKTTLIGIIFLIGSLYFFNQIIDAEIATAINSLASVYVLVLFVSGFVLIFFGKDKYMDKLFALIIKIGDSISEKIANKL